MHKTLTHVATATLQSARALGSGPPAEQAQQLPPSFFDGGSGYGGGAAASGRGGTAAPQYASNDVYRVPAPEAAAAAGTSYDADVGPARPPAGGYAEYADYGGYGAAGLAAAAAAAAAPAQPQHHYGAAAG